MVISGWDTVGRTSVAIILVLMLCFTWNGLVVGFADIDTEWVNGECAFTPYGITGITITKKCHLKLRVNEDGSIFIAEGKSIEK